ncbi:hypothetical protein GCM10025780_29190 [Frondihabitans cladoniiphilus]|uniref:Uncharacterized protein n=1 Tax=Frondihabitans cladoniiphilus TaxID=715785 RepID=A0ABP8W5F3_9MICO
MHRSWRRPRIDGGGFDDLWMEGFSPAAVEKTSPVLRLADVGRTVGNSGSGWLGRAAAGDGRQAAVGFLSCQREG